MALTREVVRVNQAQDLASSSTWAITLVVNQDIEPAAPYVFPATTGFSGVNDALLSCVVDLISGTGQLTITVNQSPDGSSWTAVASWVFDNGRMVRGGGYDRKLINGPNDYLSVTAQATGNSKWFIRAVTAVVGILETGGGSGSTVNTDTIWDAAGDLAVGSGPDTAQRLPVGTLGQVLTVDTTLPLKLKWATPPGVGTSISTSPYWQIQSTGEYDWAPGNSQWDIGLKRYGPGQLQLTGDLLANGRVFIGAGTDFSVYLYRYAGNIVGIIGGYMSGGALSGWGYQTIATGDSQPRVFLRNDAYLMFGDGTNSLDTWITRLGPGVLGTNGQFNANGNIVANAGKARQMMLVDNGNYAVLGFGPGNDTVLYRAAAGQLQTDGWLAVLGNFYAGSKSGGGWAFEADSSGTVLVNGQPIGGIPVQDEGVALTLRNKLNFTGGGVLAQDDAANARTNVLIASPAGLQTGTTPPANPTTGTVWQWDNGVFTWTFVYRPDMDATYPWFFIGGPPLGSNASGATLSVSITIPRDGTYVVSGGGAVSVTGGGDASITLPDGQLYQTGTNQAAAYSTGTYSLTSGTNVIVSRTGGALLGAQIGVSCQPIKIR